MGQSSNWTLQNGYTTNDLESFPRRVLELGTAMGLNIILKLPATDLEYICRGAFQGFKIVMHTPGEILNLSKQFSRVPLGQEVMIGVHPSMVTTSQGLTGHLPERRQCFFSDERELRFFKVYSKRSYDLECLTNYTYLRCGCVKF